jgi:hypothetical protein
LGLVYIRCCILSYSVHNGKTIYLLLEDSMKELILTIPCEWCGGQGYEPTDYDTIDSCSECQGSGVEMQYTIPQVILEEEKRYAC